MCDGLRDCSPDRGDDLLRSILTPADLAILGAVFRWSSDAGQVLDAVHVQ